MRLDLRHQSNVIHKSSFGPVRLAERSAVDTARLLARRWKIKNTKENIDSWALSTSARPGDLQLSSSLYGHWLPKIQLSGAFRLWDFWASCLNSRIRYFTSHPWNLTFAPESCRLSRSRWGELSFTPLIWSKPLGLLYFTVTTITTSLPKEHGAWHYEASQRKHFLDLSRF